jgi:hypothetical protein
MPTPQLSAEDIQHRVNVYNEAGKNGREAARRLGIDPKALRDTLKKAALRGLMLDHPPAMPGFEISKVSTDPDGGQHVTQKREAGEVFEMPATHTLGKMTVQRDPSGRVVQDWIRVMPDEAQREAAMRAVVDASRMTCRAPKPVLPVPRSNDELLNQYTITDLHLGMLAWGEETRVADWDLKLPKS